MPGRLCSALRPGQSSAVIHSVEQPWEGIRRGLKASDQQAGGVVQDDDHKFEEVYAEQTIARAVTKFDGPLVDILGPRDVPPEG